MLDQEINQAEQELKESLNELTELEQEERTIEKDYIHELEEKKIQDLKKSLSTSTE